MSSNAARRIAEEDLAGLTEEQRRILADQAGADHDAPADPELLASIEEGIAECQRGDYVDAEVLLSEIRARRSAAG
jgi:hypothetical protein